jgi:hypothetical protein
MAQCTSHSFFPINPATGSTSVPNISTFAVQIRNFVLMAAFTSLLLGCSQYRTSSQLGTPQTSISVSISPNVSQIMAGQSLQFAAAVIGNPNSQVSWAVNGVNGGGPATGTVSSTGLYAAPSNAPTAGTVTITATSVADGSQSANAIVNIQNMVAVSPASVSLATGTTQQFNATVNGVVNSPVVWEAGGVPGGNGTTGTISASGLYTAPSVLPTSNIIITAVDASDSQASATGTISFFDPEVIAAHDAWLIGVDDAAASYGCTDTSVQQQPTESISEVINRFGQTAIEGSCLDLWPISTNPNVIRYSFAWGGTVAGKDIFYISDVSQMRIWDGTEATGN